ncbi:hypothetical protein [Polaribacter sp.]|uniref:hypothetical protein n=1 Tax=Polaribacter sp. TaxID=1920175 RepID=UPI003EF2FC20
MKILRTNNISCSENWDKMTSVDKGKFCLNCNKKILDFERLTNTEIINEIKKSEKPICARIPKYKTDIPLVNEKILPKYSKLAVKIIITSSLIFTNNINTLANTNNFNSELSIVNSNTLFKGKFLREKDNSPIVNVKIQLITLNKIFYTYTNSKGEFSLNISSENLNDENVFRISYDEVPKSIPPKLEFFSTPDFIIKKENINNEKIVIAENEMFYLGMSDMILIGEKNGVIPLVYYKGKEISYEEYEKNKNKGLYKYDNYFGQKRAEVICGKKAKNGLILLF